MSATNDEALLESIAQAISNIEDGYKKANQIKNLIPNTDLGDLEGVGEFDDSFNRVIPLDVAIMAVHLITARVCFTSFPDIITNEIVSATETATGLVARALGLIEVFGRVANLIGNLLSLTELAVAVYKDGEQVDLIRDTGYLFRKQLVSLVLFGRNTRRREYVSSRHYTPKQRKPNKSWTRLH